MALGLLKETAHGFRSASAEDLLRADGLCSAFGDVTRPDQLLFYSKCAKPVSQIILVFVIALFLCSRQIALAQTWQAGFDFRSTQGFVTDPPGNNYVLAANTMYPTTGNGVTFGWTSTGNKQLAGLDRNATVDPRLAGMNYVLNNVTPAVFQVDLPTPGVYNVSLAIGDSGNFPMCASCKIEFRDGSNSLFVLTVSGGIALGSFVDANGKVWSAASWPTSNTTRQITLSGTHLTVLLGTGTGNASTASILSFLGITQQNSPAPDFTVSASPTAVSVATGSSGTSTITTTSIGGFNSAISLSSSGAPSGVTVTFNPTSIPGGAGSSTMTMAVASGTATGTYPITVTASGGGITHTTTVNLTITASSDFTVSASPTAVSVATGSSGTSTITTTSIGGFNSAISLSSSGAPSGVTVTFNPTSIPGGAGSSTMTMAVASGTATGTYPITVTASGGGITHTTTVNLTITASSDFTVSASPTAVSVATGSSGTSTITTTSIGGFNSAISLSSSGAPSGVTVTFNPTSIPGGAGSSTMTMAVASGTATGTYPITVTGSSGSLTHSTNVNLTVTSSQTWQAGFDFRSTQGFVTDPPGNNYVLAANTMYPTTGNGVTFGWTSTGNKQLAGLDRNATVDPRLAGMNYVLNNVTPAVFQVDLPTPGVYNVSLAIGDSGNFPMCASCKIEFRDGSNSLFVLTVSGGIALGSFVDANGKVWSAASWPTSNTTRQITLSGTHLTVLLGTGTGNASTASILSFLGITQQNSPAPDFTVSASPTAVSVATGSSGTSTITTTSIGGFNSAISLSSSGAPSGVTVTFNPTSIPGGAGSSTMTMAVASGTATGTYPITVTASGGGITHTTTVNLTITASSDFTVSASPTAVSVATGSSGTSTITTTSIGGFNSAISLSSSGAPSGVTVTFNPTSIPGGAGSSTMTMAVASGTATGTYPITVTASGGGITHTTTVNLTITASSDFTVSASPTAVSVATGSSGTSTITTTSIGGFNSAISLSSSGAPSGVTVTFNPTSIPGGAGSSTMTMAVASGTATGTYPITVTGSSGSLTHSTNVNLTVTSSQTWQAGFDFRSTQGFVTDPPGNNYVLAANTMYPTTGNGVTFGWTSTGNKQLAGLDRNATVDPRLAGMNYVPNNVTPAVFQVDLPTPGVYNVSLAIGDSGNFSMCASCKIEFRDGSNSLFVLTVSGGIALGSFVDANGNVWSAASWPTSNTTRQITLSGTHLTVLLGTGTGNASTASILSFLGISSGGAPTAILSPSSLTFGSVVVGNTSPAQLVTLTNSGVPTLNITSIVSSGDFAQTNNCPALLPSSKNCTISVTFTPTATGTRNGAITITDNAINSPQSVPLTGNGVTMLLSISPQVATLTVGQQQQFNSNMPASWSVDGIPGGNTSVGTISSAGLYTAPAAAGSHTVTATASGMTQTAQVYVSNYTGVFTYHNDNARTGQNTQETVLTPALVNSTQFGKLFSVPVDGYVYAQPLYVSHLNFSGTIHNVVYLATENDTLYAIDADNGTVLWQLSLIPSGASTGLPGDIPCTEALQEIGITGTPVIDSTSNTIYLVTTTKENGSYVQRLHAIDIINKTEKFGGPVVIAASVSGTGEDSIGGVVSFNPLREFQRPGLLLQNGQVSIGWASYCDARPYHGWVIAYNATNLAQQVGVFNDTPNGHQGGIWMSGGGLAGDANFNTYLATGNGDYDGNTEFGDSILNLGPPSNDSFRVATWFTPWDQNTMNDTDGDLGSGGILLLPDLPPGPPHQHLLVEAGKEGTIYLVDRDNMGEYCSSCIGGDPQIVQELQGVLLNALLATPAYWNGNVYFAPNSQPVLAFSFNSGGSGLLSTSPIASSPSGVGGVGSSLVISANGNTNAIVWALDNSSFVNGGGGCCQVLHAYDAISLAELYNSSQAPNNRDAGGPALHFNVPVIANAKVYVGAQGMLVIYGLLPR